MSTPATAALIGAIVSIFFGPLVAAFYAHRRSTKAFRAHVSDVVRDFQESSAVMAVLLANRRQPAMPVSGHITKIAIPDELLTTKVVKIGELGKDDRAQALWLVNILVNINRDVASIIKLLDNNRYAAFYEAVSELQNKMENLARKIKTESPFLEIPKPSAKAKTIFFDDGTKATG